MPSLYDTVRANVEKSGRGHDERVEVNQRALIDKILARYASAGAVYRELLQNSNDAEATVAEIHFTTKNFSNSEVVETVCYKNNGFKFRPQDWARLKKIAEGNPDEKKIGAFGVGAYTMFSICEEPIVISGNGALLFVWKGDALWTKTVDRGEADNGPWTSFVLPSRDPFPLPDMVEFGEFLCASLTFTKFLSEIRVFVNESQQMTLTKTQLQEPAVVQIQKSSTWWKSDGAVTASPTGLFSLQDEHSLLESFHHVQVTLDGETAAVMARYISGIAKTKIPNSMVARMERVTKKKPPSEVEVQIFLNGQDHENAQQKSKAAKIIQSFSPRIGEGRVFIGFRTSQTTGLAAHLAAPFVPTVEREAMDLQDPTLRTFNMELLEFSGILMRLTLEHGMTTIGEQYERGAVERAKLEQEFMAQPAPTLAEDGNPKDTNRADSTDDGSSKSSVWGFAKFMAKGVKKSCVQVVNKVEVPDDDQGELMNPKDPRPLCAEEYQSILLMQSFCPRQSTPDPLVGTTLAQGFSRCLPNKSPPVLTRSGVWPGKEARLPFNGMEFFCKEGVVRSIVYQNAKEYHTVIAQCRTLKIDDLFGKMSRDALEEPELVRFLKWWVTFRRIQNTPTATGLRLKGNIHFILENNNGNKTNQGDVSPVFSLKDYLFYLDKDEIRTGSGVTIDSLPMPDSVLPKTIQESLSIRTLTEPALKTWFSPLPIKVWVEFISDHRCMSEGQPEDETPRFQVLSTLNQEYSKRSLQQQEIFGSFCKKLLKDKPCLPFDSFEPTALCADIPSNLYLYSAELEAFDGIGNFHRVSLSLKHTGVSDDFLVALGVRRSVAIEFLFTHLDTFQWSSDPKPLVEYLRSASLTKQDVNKLKSAHYLPAENGVSRMFSPSELYLPDRDLRVFPFVRILQWPSEDELTENSPNGKFLVTLGVKVLPPLLQVLKFISNQIEDDKMRIDALEFVCRRLGSGGMYQAEYGKMGTSEKSDLKFMPCVAKSPIDGNEKKATYSVLACCSVERCKVMGFPVIDPGLGDTGKQFGNLFQCAQEPDPKLLIQQLRFLVNSAKKLLNPLKGDLLADSKQVAAAFSEIFCYLSNRSSEISPSLMRTLEGEEFIPCIVNGDVKWYRPNGVFFRSTHHAEVEDSITERLFRVVDFSPFLAAAGVKQEASITDIFRRMIESPKIVLSAFGSEERYKTFLRQVAAQRPFRRVTTEIQDSPFLLGLAASENSSETSYELAKSREIFIIDNSFLGRMFPVTRCPHESQLEIFYSLIGSRYISKEVIKEYQVVGVAKENTPLTEKLSERIQERGPLLVSPSVTSRPLVRNAKTMLDENSLKVYEAPDLNAVYSLGTWVRNQQTTCYVEPGKVNKNSLYVTADFDWFDVGQAIGGLILERCQLEDAFFISSLLETPLEQLRARGFPVDRIIKPIVPEPECVVSSKTSFDCANANNPPSFSSSITPPLSSTKSPMSPSHSVEFQKMERSAGGDKGSEESHPKWPKSKASDSSHDSTVQTMSLDSYVSILKQMYPDADENYLRNRLGENPSLDEVRSLAEEMATMGYPKASSQASTDDFEEAKEDTSSSKPSKIFGSKKLGRAFNGFRGGIKHQMPSTQAGSTMQTPPSTQHYGSTVSMLPAHQAHQHNFQVPPEMDATPHTNMERMLQQAVKQSSRVVATGLSSPEIQMSIPEGLDRGGSCEVIPGQGLKPFTIRNEKGNAHNGIKVFSARKHPSSEVFLAEHFDAVESFAVVLERLCGIYGLKLPSVAIFHDPTGGTIAFNANKSLHFNVRFFYALHYLNNMHQRGACFSYWFVTFAHELAHHMVSGHNMEHGFYTESYMSLYMPQFMALLSQID